MKDCLVYICGPISKGDLLHNIQQADAAFFALLRSGIPAICPHWNVYSGGAMRDPDSDEVYAVAGAAPNGTTAQNWYGLDLQIVKRCGAVLRLPGESVGADLEVKCAEEHGIPVFYALVDVFLWAQTFAKNGE